MTKRKHLRQQFISKKKTKKNNKLVKKGGASKKKLENFNNTVRSLFNNISVTSILGNNPLVRNSVKKEELEKIKKTQNAIDLKNKMKSEDQAIESIGKPSFIDSLKKKESSLQDDNPNRGLFSSLRKKMGVDVSNLANRISTPTLSGKLKEVSENTDRIKEMSRQTQCDARFITGLETLLNTCSKKEAINIYNECVRILKTKKRSFSDRLMNDIEEINLLNYDDEGEEKKEVLIPGVALRKMSSDRITKLEEDINSKLGIKKPPTKKKKKKKKKN